MEDNGRRAEQFHRVLDRGNLQDVAAMCKCLYRQKQKRAQDNKGLPANDAKMLEQAEWKLHDELAYVLNIKEEDVRSYIQNKMSEKQKSA